MTNNPFESLASQIESEKERVAREAAERKARARAAAMAKEVAKKQAVEEALRNRNSKGSAHKPAAAAPKRQAPVLGARKSSFDSLLSQIESEKQRIEKQKAEQPARGADANKQQRGARKHGKKGMHVEQHVPELEQQASGEDRYAQMAVKAEELQRDKVLAEARAAVAAANSHEGEGRRKKRKQKREAEARERMEMEAIERGLDPSLVLDDSVVEIPQGSTVAKFAELLGVQPNDVIKRLFMLGQVLTLTQSMSDELVELIADDMGRKVRVVSPEEEFAIVYHDSDEDLKPRPPVVTVMGHVDHGKTSLLDAIRHTGVAEGEAGGITQHIGASVVRIGDRQITFIDTPGHEAFTAMRARGAQVTDVIVLVVASDDGVMPQTIEAINHAKAANVPIVVAVNKIDKPGANPDRVRQELVEYGVIPEDWGGQNMFVNVSAKKKLHIDDLLETILLQADVLELRANPDALASGFVIEANLDKGRGPVATVLVQRGTLHPGDTVVAGTSYGRVRALVDPRGQHVEGAAPSYPVEILGLNSVPVAGDEFRVFEDERDARKLAEERALRARLAEQETKSHMNLDDLFNRIEEGKQTDLNLIVKADVQGSIEALRDAFNKMDQSEVQASTSCTPRSAASPRPTSRWLRLPTPSSSASTCARPASPSSRPRRRRSISACTASSIRPSRTSMRPVWVCSSPRSSRRTPVPPRSARPSRCPKVGTIAGCYITDGELHRDDKIRLVREGTVIFEGELASLKPLQGRREGRQAGLRVRHRHRRLSGPQGRRHYRGLHHQGS